MNKIVLKVGITGVCILFLAGCGFHLRGTINLPGWLNNIAIISNSQLLQSTIKTEFEAINIQVSEEPSLAKYWLIIELETFSQHIISVSSSTTPRQYQLIYTVRFKLQQKEGKELTSPTTFVITRQLTVNSDRILGSDDEEATIKQEMRRDAAWKILNRISHQ